MPDELATEAAPTEARCTWCSAVLPDPSAATCPSCGATLIGEGETAGVPGLTAIDADAILRNARGTGRTKPRSGILGWISGEYPVDESAVATPESLAPPTADVRREMLRLELEAQVANLQAEAGAMAAEQAVDAVDAGANPDVAKADAQAALEAADEVIAAAAPAETLQAPEPHYVTPDAAEPAETTAASGPDATPDAAPDATAG